MSRVLYVDAIGGAAGDMLLAALMDAGAPEAAVREAVEAVIPGRFRFGLEPVTRAGVRAAYLRIEDGPARPNGGPLVPRPLRDLLAAVDEAALDPLVKAAARSVLERIGQAEAHAHGVQPDEVHLHELGDDDTLLDVVGFAAAIRSLGVDRILVSSLPLPPTGTGVATLRLLEGFSIRGHGARETVTPTGAAILSALGHPVEAIPSMRLEATGYGAGSDDPPDGPNVVRIMLGTPEDAREDPAQDGLRHRTLVVLEANLDDLTPELLADAAEALFAAGALDAWTAPIGMKKGRPAVLLSALCEQLDEPRVRHAFFEATSTFGVRGHRVDRAELERRSVAVSLRGGDVRVKVGLLDGRVMSATPEHDEVAELAARSGSSVREVYEEAVAAARELRYQGTGQP